MRPKELFDLAGSYQRKVSLSWLDQNIDDQNDWQSLVDLVCGVDKLLIVDDRSCGENPILCAYDRYTKRRYIAAFEHVGVAAEIVASSDIVDGA